MGARLSRSPGPSHRGAVPSLVQEALSVLLSLLVMLNLVTWVTGCLPGLIVEVLFPLAG